MINQRLVSIPVFCAALATGCSPASDSDDLDFRSAPAGVEFWEEDPLYAGNGNIEVHDSDSTDVPDTIIWDIDGPSVSQHVRLGSIIDILLVEDNAIFEIDLITGETGPMVCTAFEGDHPSGRVHKLADASGTVLFTKWDRLVFAGDVEIPPASVEGDGSMLQGDILLSFKDDQVFLGGWWDGDRLVTIDAEVDKANPMRQLLLTALLTGECGSFGL